jgi:hypothetical protein
MDVAERFITKTGQRVTGVVAGADKKGVRAAHKLNRLAYKRSQNPSISVVRW